MNTTSGIWPQDRADFDELLQRALDERRVREALRADPSGAAARRLRARALAAADEIAAAADEEYRVYLAVRVTAGTRTPVPESPVAPSDRALPAVLLPLLAAVSGVTLLLVGYGLRRGDLAPEFAASVRTAGLLLTGIAAGAGAVGLLALLVRAALRRGSHPGADTERARRRWRRALLERGVEPYVRRHLPDALTP
ncbi:hypothetical protein [Streptomyces sp. NPDC087294]|uniref:hypothetical protein n=1 Tax=Streptomyces sp. NPDC087294 TaxID=3365777 RepID=UPI0038240B10